MPDTKIFNSTLRNATSYGDIVMQGEGDTADITFTDHNHNKTKAQLKVYTYSNLKKSKEFKNAHDENSVEKLVHEWKTRKSENAIIKYSGKDQLAFIFTSDNNVNDDFEKLFSGNDVDDISGQLFLYHCLFNVDYFDEVRFQAFLQNSAGLDVAQLRQVPGMTDKRVNLFMRHRNVMETLLKEGVTIEQLAQANMSMLKKFLASPYHFNEALKFVTIQQIFGVSHTPPAIEDFKQERERGFAYYKIVHGDDKYEYQYQYYDGEINIVITPESLKVKENKDSYQLCITFRAIKEEKWIRAQFTADSPCEYLVHRWYKINPESGDKGYTREIHYSPEWDKINIMKVGNHFPVNDFMSSSRKSNLDESPYYKELHFVEFLKEKRTSLDKLREIPGMTQKKLEVMSVHTCAIKDLLKRGMTFTDFANINEERFVYVISNFNSAKPALEFVHPRELFGLGDRHQRHFGLFERSAATASTCSSMVANWCRSVSR